MEKISIPKDNLQNMLVPFKYKSALIYSTEFTIPGVSYDVGLYGFGQNIIFFEDKDVLPDTIEIEIPTTTEELQEFIGAIDYIVQKISLNGDSIFIEGLNQTIPTKLILKPFVSFVKNYEKNIFEIERLKYD
jgi:hypothetical protein